MKKKIVFVVVTLGYWGKGETIEQAAAECRKAGSKGNEPGGRLIVGKFDPKDVSVDGMGCIHYPNGADLYRIVSPSDGHKVKLGALIPKGFKLPNPEEGV